MKIVINRCFGGFCISKEAAEHMAKNGSERAKQELLKRGYFYGFGFVDGFSGGYDRADPLLIAAVEELKERVNGDSAKLVIVEIPDNIDYEIEDYDGREKVREKSRSWF